MTHLNMEFFLLVAASVAPVISAVHGDPGLVYNYILMQRMMECMHRRVFDKLIKADGRVEYPFKFRDEGSFFPPFLENRPDQSKGGGPASAIPLHVNAAISCRMAAGRILGAEQGV